MRTSLVLKLSLAAGILGALLLSRPFSAEAEGVLDVYGGIAHHRPAELSINRTAPATTIHTTADAPDSMVLGARVKYWFETKPWVCVGGDLDGYAFDSPVLKADVFPVSVFTGIRVPFASTADHPSGRIQVYGLGGISVVIADVSVSVSGMNGHTSFGPWSSTTPVIPYLAAGLAVQPWREYGLFLEYRRVGFDAHFITTNSVIIPTSNTNFDASFSADQFLFGLTIRFPARKGE
jgi:hypothetical protein